MALFFFSFKFFSAVKRTEHTELAISFVGHGIVFFFFLFCFWFCFFGLFFVCVFFFCFVFLKNWKI